MNHARQHVEETMSGIKKEEFEVTIQVISDQIRWIEQKLTIKVEKEIYKAYEKQHHFINQLKSGISS